MSMYKEIMCNFDFIMEAYHKAHSQKTDSPDVIEFDKNKIYNLHKIQKQLENKEWDKLFVYYRFMLTRPKKRPVDAMIFEGRIVQHVLCDHILRPYFEPKLVKENCACRKNKGTDYALNLVKQGLVDYLKTHDDGYVLKIDIKSYFPSIDREILKQLISDFPDEEVREMLIYLLDHCPDVGLPVGNQSSQWFALYYMDILDRLCKEKYHIKVYSRYMDDFIAIDESKEKLQDLFTEFALIAEEERHLILNAKSQVIKLHRGFSFLGWRFYYTDTKKVIRKVSNEKRQYRKENLITIYKDFENNGNIKLFNDRIRSTLVNLNKGNNYTFIVKNKIQYA